jgi:hypothetical protein
MVASRIGPGAVGALGVARAWGAGQRDHVLLASVTDEHRFPAAVGGVDPQASLVAGNGQKRGISVNLWSP